MNTAGLLQLLVVPPTPALAPPVELPAAAPPLPPLAGSPPEAPLLPSGSSELQAGPAAAKRVTEAPTSRFLMPSLSLLGAPPACCCERPAAARAPPAAAGDTAQSAQGSRIVRYQGAGLVQLPHKSETTHVLVSSIPGNAAPLSSVSVAKSTLDPDVTSLRQRPWWMVSSRRS